MEEEEEEEEEAFGMVVCGEFSRLCEGRGGGERKEKFNGVYNIYNDVTLCLSWDVF